MAVENAGPLAIAAARHPVDFRKNSSLPPAAAIGLELPCRGLPLAEAHAFLFLEDQLLGRCEQRAGRLLPPRHLGRALNSLLLGCREELKERLLRLPPGHAVHARELAEAHLRWEAGVRRRMTPHHLRAPCCDRFLCWALPRAAYHQLLRQHHPLEPPGARLHLLFLLPISPSLRLLDKVSAYLHPPGRCLPGPWLCWPEALVQATLCRGCWVVVIG